MRAHVLPTAVTYLFWIWDPYPFILQVLVKQVRKRGEHTSGMQDLWETGLLVWGFFFTIKFFCSTESFPSANKHTVISPIFEKVIPRPCITSSFPWISLLPFTGKFELTVLADSPSSPSPFHSTQAFISATSPEKHPSPCCHIECSAESQYSPILMVTAVADHSLLPLSPLISRFHSSDLLLTSLVSSS